MEKFKLELTIEQFGVLLSALGVYESELYYEESSDAPHYESLKKLAEDRKEEYFKLLDKYNLWN